MPELEIVIAPAAERELRKLDKAAFKAVSKLIDQLQTEPRPRGCEKIQGHPGFFRVRAGDFRVIYYPMTPDRLVVLVVRDRKDAYKINDDLEKRLRSAS